MPYENAMQWLNDSAGNPLAAWVPGKGWVQPQNASYSVGGKLSGTNFNVDPEGGKSLSNQYYETGRDAQLANGGQYILGSVGGSSDPFSKHVSSVDGLDLAGLNDQQKALFDPNSNWGSSGYDIWGSGTDSSVSRPSALYKKPPGEESFMSQLFGGTSDPNSDFGGRPWWGPPGAGGAALAAGGALAAGASAAGGAAAGAGESVSGAYGATAGELGGYAGTYGAGADAAWGVNPQGGSMFDEFGNFDFGNGPTGTDPFTGGSAGGDFIPNTEWPTQNLWNTGPTPSGPPMVSWDGASPVPFTQASLYEQMVQKMGETGAKSALSKLMSGEASSSDYANLLGKLGAAGLGALGSANQSKSLSDLAAKYQEYGAPSRGRFEASMTPGFDPNSIPGYAGALDTANKGILARLSATGGNPFQNPGGLIEANKQIVSGTAMPAINEYQRLNANTGFGSSMNAALGLQTGGITADRGITTALSSGLESLTQPQNSLSDLLRSLQRGGLA